VVDGGSDGGVFGPGVGLEDGMRILLVLKRRVVELRERPAQWLLSRLLRDSMRTTDLDSSCRGFQILMLFYPTVQKLAYKAQECNRQCSRVTLLGI
jgi:hypothetical protein